MVKQIMEEYHLGNSPTGEINIHDWMSYREFVDSYYWGHFTILARVVLRKTLESFLRNISENLSHEIIPICSKGGDHTKLYLEDGKNSSMMDGCDVNTILHDIRRSLIMIKNN